MIVEEGAESSDDELERYSCSEDFTSDDEGNSGSNKGFPEGQSEDEDFDSFEFSMNKMSITPKHTESRMPSKLPVSSVLTSDMPARVKNMPARLLANINDDL